eukprot:TRINITY_DN17059_c0_g2_i1.p1 TRINITY_DN17059_c0_g2~~TRINITY_DN17059_c0_g2_i1.p1  ORF type:complete len:327 (+),score=73.44 TRINITY_DN17059_c0_g2_i1:78-1058(+)
MRRLVAPINWLLEAMLLKDVQRPEDAPPAPAPFPLSLLRSDPESAEAAVLSVLSGSRAFTALCQSEAASLQQDAGGGRSGDLAIVDSRGCTPEEIAEVILGALATAAQEPAVVVVQGMPGAGKDAVARVLSKSLPRCCVVNASDVLRCVTLLAVRHCERRGLDLRNDAAQVLVPGNCAKWAGMVHLDGPPERRELRVRGLGVDASIDELRCSLLQLSAVAGNIEVVARHAQESVQKLLTSVVHRVHSVDGGSAVVVGSDANVSCVQTKHRFELQLDFSQERGTSAATALVLQRAAQLVPAGAGPATDVSGALREAAALLLSERVRR